MAIPRRPRKRVRAIPIPRAADGSAFRKCDMCGVSVPIALADMHECQSTQELKRFKGIRARATKNDFTPETFSDQPRSAFCFFMEEFKATCESEDPIEIDRKGFNTWKNMSKEEREPFVREAALVNFKYEKGLRQEEGDLSSKVDFDFSVTTNWCLGCSDSGWLTYAPREEKKGQLLGSSIAIVYALKIMDSLIVLDGSFMRKARTDFLRILGEVKVKLLGSIFV